MTKEQLRKESKEKLQMVSMSFAGIKGEYVSLDEAFSQINRILSHFPDLTDKEPNKDRTYPLSDLTDEPIRNGLMGKLNGHRIHGKSYDADGNEFIEKHEKDCPCCRDNLLGRKADLTDKGWEDGFDMMVEKRGFAFINNPPAIKHFISYLLAAQKKEIINDYQTNFEQQHIISAVELAKKEIADMVERMKVNDDELGLGKEYDKALSDLLAKLKE